MYKKILVAYDGSDHAKKAVERASALAKAFGASVYVITVSTDPSQVSLEKAKKIAQEAANALKAKGVNVDDIAVRSGTPATEILNYAEEKEVDLIVMGSRGLSAIQRLVLGSVSQAVVSRARVPVLVVR
ncbi:universal stress protein [Pyrobaculum aerophilum]|uniref:Universal stress protein UspA n=1 Tax=Pyrobaculum aerophilum TaxID=13773 RepID=A0A371QVL7_9CREN|nr:universal stress protein [Pyrobaculum aerophilum]RFA94232.1 universal stress protein UspA [Pyrobaculum aerophilum]RFA94901.1 universal stress protein UspA [Pyrobaculum aerophilum]